MADIFKFQGENCEEYCCEACQVTDEYLEMALDCETPEELRAAIRNLYDDAHTTGYEDALRDDINVKVQLLEQDHDDLI